MVKVQMKAPDHIEDPAAEKGTAGAGKETQWEGVNAKQRIRLIMLWHEVCRVRGWPAAQAWRRHKFYETVLGQPKRLKDFTPADLAKVEARFRQLAQHGPGADDAAGLPALNFRGQLLWKIRRQQRALLALYVPDPDACLLGIAREQCQLPLAGLEQLEGLSGAQLAALHAAVAAKIEDCRTQAGETVGRMLRRSGFGKGWRREDKKPLRVSKLTGRPPGGAGGKSEACRRRLFARQPSA